MKIYISGPMTGYPHLNFPLFDAIAEELEKLGWEVVSPARLERERGSTTYRTHRQSLKDDIVALMDCDAIYMLPSWQHSRGAGCELVVAASLGLLVYYDEYAKQFMLRLAEPT